jgi:hypothetical protein
MSYVMRCETHPKHCDECMVCIRFDAAIRQFLINYNTPPSQHSSVLGPQVREWMTRVFPTPS